MAFITLQIKRGVLANIPALAEGEMYFATDTEQLMMGTSSTPVEITGNADAIRGAAISSTGPGDGQILIFDSVTGHYVPGDPIVSGPDAVGVNPTRNPVQIGAIDPSGNVQRLFTDNSGALQVTGVTAVIGSSPSRQYLTFIVDAAAGVTTEALATMTINKAETVTSATSYTVSTGKVLRIQSISASATSDGSTLDTVQIRLRTAASSISATSPMLVALAVTPATGSSTTGACGYAEQSFPDGIEIATGHQIAISQVITAGGSNHGLITVTVVGYEY